MSKFRFTATALAITAISGVSLASAQDRSNPVTGQSVQAEQATTVADKPIQQEAGSKTGQRDRTDARRTLTDNRRQKGPTVKEALTQKLIKSNEAEIELATMAQEKADNDDVKQFAAMLVKDHQEFNKTLQQHAGKKQANQSNSDNANATDRRQATTGNTSPSRAATVPKQLCKVAEQACENSLKMTKEMLSKHEGQDFSMAFLAQQCVCHTTMLAELQAIESVGPKELKQLAAEAAVNVKKHLETAKQLAKKIEDDRKSRS